jgi:hypothetical protein
MDRDNHCVSGALSGNRFALARRLGNPFGTVKPIYFSNSAQGIDAGPSAKEPPGAFGPAIARAAVQSIGVSTKKLYGPPARSPEYALAVSLIFTKATNQCIILGTEPPHVLSTSILWNSLLHDSRFKQIVISNAMPGDIITQSGWHQATGFAGIVVDHGRIVSNSSRGVQDNFSLAEIQRAYPAMAVFRYLGVQKFANSSLANSGYDPDKPRVATGQTGGGQWTSGDRQTTGLKGVFAGKIKSRRCADDDEETDPVLREDQQLRDRLENFRELTPDEKEYQKNEADPD